MGWEVTHKEPGGAYLWALELLLALFYLLALFPRGLALARVGPGPGNVQVARRGA